MTFSGATDKCKACDKTVYFIEMVTADGIAYHKKCFKCTHCNGLLVMGNHCSVDSVLHCIPHFEQLFKETGSYTKIFQSSGEKKNGLVTVEGEFYHKSCFRCAHGGCFLTTSSYAALDGTLYCKHHFAQLFKEKGSYNNLRKSASLKKDIPVPTEEKPDEPEEETKAAVVSEDEAETQPEQEPEPEAIADQPLHKNNHSPSKSYILFLTFFCFFFF